MNNSTIPGVISTDCADVTSIPLPPEQSVEPEQAMSIRRVRSACRTLETFGTWLGWGLPALGIVAGVELLMDMRLIQIYGPNPIDWIGNFMRLGYVIAAYSLAGTGTLALSRLLAAVIVAYFENLASGAKSRSDQTERCVVAVERLVKTLESWNGAVVSGPIAGDHRSRLLAEINRTIRASLWDQAAAMLDDFAAEFADDPALPKLRAELVNARGEANRQHLAQLEAAREVNDPDRVFEIYQTIAPSLDTEARITLDRELAKWFLTLIHRRLRTGTIQSDVVQLASRFSEVFAATVEGASVRAALPTLRRSVGLCPRCSQPYAGVAEACPKCLSVDTS
jgi:hypothetical protein